MAKPERPSEARPGFFLPRVTLMMAGGVAIAALSLALYAMPAVTAPVPAGAVVDYRAERVRARLEGVVPWFVAGSFLTSALIGHVVLRWRERRRST